MKGIGLAVLAVALLLAALTVKGVLHSLPEPSQGESFQAHRAAERLARILGAERAHPVDSAANDAVRDRLVAEMRAVGLEPRITDDFACNAIGGRAVACARVRNLVAAVGPSEGRHVLLSAHYDSTFAGPGAADAGIGVATLLEVAALIRGRRLERPVTFLFNEGEEMGLIGARAFIERDPLAARVGTLINLEARGVAGPAIMFETSRPNASAIALYAGSVDRPVANSLSTDLYRLIPNSTDVAVFADRDWTILNLAAIGNETRYHSAGDDMAALDRRSLQHMGNQALALTLTAAAGEVPQAEGERLYADLLGRQLLVLPLVPGLVLLGLLVVGSAALAWRRRALGRPLAAIVAAFAGSALFAWLGHFLVGLLRAGDWWRGHPWVTELAVYASATAAALLALMLLARDVDVRRLRAAFWLAFLLAGGALSSLAPGGAIFFLAPPLAFAAGSVAARRWPVAERVGAVAAAALLFLTHAPALHLFEELMSNGPHWTFAPLGAAILLPWLIELKPLFPEGGTARTFALAGAGDLFLLGWIAAALAPAYSADRQQLFTIEYVRDEAERRTLWAVSNDGRPVPFGGGWTREELPYSTRRRWVSDAPALPVQAPALTVVASGRTGGRRFRLRIAANGSQAVALIAPPEARLIAGGAPGFMHRYDGPDDERRFLRCIGRSCDGAEVDLVLGTGEPVELTVVGTRSGLPPPAAPLVAARPALARPQYSPDSTIAIGRLRL